MIPRLHLVTDDAILQRAGFLESASAVVAAGGSSLALHVRGPRSTGALVLEQALALSDVAEASEALLLVNDRVDVALALGLDGVHLGQRSLPPRVARRLIGPEALVGLSVHGRGEVEAAGEEVVDFMVGGSVFSTPSHPGRAGFGLEEMGKLVEAAAVPMLAIGGITPSRVREVLRVGAHGVAVRGGVWDADDPVDAMGSYLRELEDMGEPDPIVVRLNGKERTIPVGVTVHGLLEHLDLNPALVVVELNREILDRGRYPEVEVQEGDQLELVHFVGGG